ncbi:MAG: HEAT repeat domain-containing protein [Acidobacteriia bacterium]|nr:HEAT repeat domain-containing protein [Terriglobia bacterium]
MSKPLILAIATSAVLLLAAAPHGAKDAADADRVVAEAMAEAHAIEAQAEALTALAWPAGGGDPTVRAMAKEKLILFGQPGMAALWKSLITVKPSDKADVVKTLLAEFRQLTGGLPPEYLPALDDAIWFGTRESRRIAIPEVARFNQEGPVLSIIDAAMEDPEILPTAVDALGRLGDPRGRFFLERVLNEGKPGVREKAAVALARVGEPGRAVLKTATRSGNKEIRLAAIRSLLPVVTVDDLSSLYEYTAAHAADDPPTAKAVDAAAARLEKILEATRAADSASPAPR